MNHCPICNRPTNHAHPQTPYWECGFCDCWFQSPLPPKLYEADHEKDAHGGFTGHLMNDGDKEVNRQLAGALFHNWLKNEPGKTLDIGSKYPFLAHCLKGLGCESYGMDNIEVVPEYSKALDVPMLLADFEAITDQQIQEWVGGEGERFKLITMVHVFEHMYEPLEALRKLRRLIADDGVLFIRLPDHSVAGFERDLTPSHFTIHPFFHSLSSLLELLVQGEDLFAIAETYALEGAGQRDMILFPLTRKPTSVAGLIVKNEERDLPKCLKSIASVVDQVVIIDTGSTDRTREVATTTIANPVHFQVYTEASRQDEHGDWKLWDFSKARNQFVEKIETLGVDWILWMDADDELLTPQNLRRALYWQQYKVFSVLIQSGCQSWPQHRLWRTGLGIHYEGRCHEYPTFGGFPCLNLADTIVRHDAAPGFGEDSNVRNLRILTEEFSDNPTPRTAFYLANTHKDGGRYAEAVPYYTSRIAMGPGFRDEWLFAYLYKARCERAAGNPAAAERTLLQAVSEERTWAEFWMELAYMVQEQGRQWHAIGYAMQAARLAPDSLTIPPTALWRENNKYTDQPARIISWSFEHLGDLEQALRWAVRAKDLIGVEDEDWNNRILRLSGRLHPKAEPRENTRVGKRSALAIAASKKLASIGKSAELKRVVDATNSPIPVIAPRDVSPFKPIDAEPAPMRSSGRSPMLTIAILAKDKAHLLNEFLRCLEDQTWPKSATAIYVRTNNNRDETKEVLRAWVERNRNEYVDIFFDDSDVENRVERFGQHEWNTERFVVLGKIRQESIEWARRRGDHYAVIDCDNLIGPDTLACLMSVVSPSLPIVSPLLHSQHGGGRYSNYHAAIDPNGYYQASPLYDALLDRRAVGLVEVPVVHCTYVIHPSALGSVSYNDGSGRYEYVIFSDSARKAGLPQYLDTRKVYGHISFAETREAFLKEPWLPQYASYANIPNIGPGSNLEHMMEHP